MVPKNGNLLKHKSAIDVAVRIQKIYIFTNKWKIKGTWCNQGYEKTFDLGINARFSISKDNLSDWFICLEPNAKCVRDVEWRKLK